MKKVLLSITFVIAAASCFGQSFTIAELMNICNTQSKQLNNLILSRGFSFKVDATPPTVGLGRYFKMKDTPTEEVIIQTEYYQPGNPIIPILNYQSNDSTAVLALQEQAKSAQFVLTDQKQIAVPAGLRIAYIYSNGQFEATFFYIKNKVYGLTLKRKE